MSEEIKLTLNSPITEEQWDAITDVDFDHTNEIIFNTKNGKVVKFVKAGDEILFLERLYRKIERNLEGV